MSLSPDQAERLLAGAAVIPAMSGSIPDMKKIRDACLISGIPALIGCPPGAGGGG